MADAAARTGGTAPRCSFSKLAPARGRKAFPLERCEHAAAGERLVLWFVDDRLVRVDAAPAPAGERARLDARLEALEGAGGRWDGRWQAGPDVVALGGDAEGAARLVVLDGAVLSRLPGLADLD